MRKQFRLQLGNALAAGTAVYFDLPCNSSDNSFKKFPNFNLLAMNHNCFPNLNNKHLFKF